MENKRAHLGMIQAIISRMAANSFLLKGWSVVIVSALFALAVGDTQTPLLYLAYFPATVFWLLDAYFVHQEVLFRKLYDRVRLLEEPQVDFSMETSIVSGQASTCLRIAFTNTFLIFHGMVVGSITIVIFVITYNS